MKVSDLSSIISVLNTDANDNSFLILNKAANGSTAPVTYKVSLTHAGKTLATNLALVNYSAANKELKAYSINNDAYANSVIGYYMDSDQVSKLAAISAQANKSDIAYDGTNKKITKTVDGTTSDVVSAATLKTDMSLNNVENKSSATIRSELTSSNVTTALGYTPLNSALKGANSGIAELDASGKVPSSQLPSYVDDVLEYNGSANFPGTGEAGKIYVDTEANTSYRWSGSQYVKVASDLSLGTTSSTAYRGDYGAAAYAAAVTNVDSAPTADSTHLVTSGGVASAISGFYTKPSSGIPSTDLASGVIPDLTNYALKETIETISSTTPSITGVANTVYKCGEVTTISITPPQSGTIDVIFTSGTTAATLTVPNTVKFPDWFDPTDLEADTIYEINIMDGVYGVVALWQ